jgi:Right handed beta helix region
VLPGVARAVPQTWVSGVGDDANIASNCSRTAPCKTFAGAISVTDPGGLISVLDPGGFGALTITKPVTIDGAGEFGGVLVSGTNGIVVNAPGGHVTLRGLTIEYIAPCTAPSTSLDGILLLAGSLSVQDVSIHGFPEDGVNAKAAADGSSLDISGSDLRENCAGGVAASTTVGHVSATLSDNFISDDGVAVLAGSSSQVTISANTIVDNAVGLASSSGGILSSLDDNRIAGNTAAGLAPVELLSPFVAPAPAPVLAPTPAPITTTVVAPLPPTCRVPNLASLTLASARKVLARARCVLGSVSYRTAKHHRRGLIYLQQPRAGTLQFQGAIVNATLDGHPLPAKKPRARRALGSGASRTWVSGVGSDANPCSRTAPCATFAGALSKTASGGIVDALDPGNFGPITLNAATINTGTVTIQGNPGATIEVPSGATGVLVDSGPGANVILRDLTIIGAPGCSGAGAGSGIDVLSGGNLHLEDVQVSGFPGSGLKVEPNASMSVTARDSTFYDNCTTGVSVQPSSGSVDLTTGGVRVLDDPTGVLAGARAVVRLGATTVSGSLTALSTSGGGLIQGWPDNDLAGDTSLVDAPGLLGFS